MNRLLIVEFKKPEYILDTNVFIESAKRYYAFDIAPGFWNSLISIARTCRVKSLDRVRDEIFKKEDHLSGWIRNNFMDYFIDTSTDEQVILKYGELIKWAKNHQHYNDNAKIEFAEEDNADPWLLAYALVYEGVTIVTGEQFKKGIKRKIPIPNACEELGLNCINTFEFLRRAGITLQ